MQISKAFIEEKGNKRLETEMQDVYDELQSRQIPVELFTAKRISRRQLLVAKDTLVVGYVNSVLASLKMLGIDAPSPNDYPEALKSFYHRHFWESTVGQLRQQVYEGSKPIFAKPKERKKRFTGHVFGYVDGLAYLEGVSNQTAILCSDVVEWLSEYRVFVIRGSIVGTKHYAGDSSITVDESIVKQAIELLEQSQQKTAAYGVDFGVLATGQTAVVEWNDGYSLGSYGLDGAIYTDLLITRWCELTGC
jgi:hypothetical protein